MPPTPPLISNVPSMAGPVSWIGPPLPAGVTSAISTAPLCCRPKLLPRSRGVAPKPLHPQASPAPFQAPPPGGQSNSGTPAPRATASPEAGSGENRQEPFPPFPSTNQPGTPTAEPHFRGTCMPPYQLPSPHCSSLFPPPGYPFKCLVRPLQLLNPEPTESHAHDGSTAVGYVDKSPAVHIRRTA